MIRDVVVHIANEQPILVDLVFEPSPADVALICRNLRLMNGKKPVFVDKTDSTFVISLSQIRFIEMPRASMEAFEAEKLAAATAAKAASAAEEEDSGEAPLARLAWLTGGGSTPAEDPAPVPAEPASAAAPLIRVPGDDLDDELLRRIREV
jgi:hypothetical protein